MVPYAENKNRAINIFKEIKTLNDITIKKPVRSPKNLLAEIHSKKYSDYLKKLSGLCIDADDYRTPYVIPAAQKSSKFFTSKIDNISTYFMDVTTPVGQFTYEAALHSADVAYSGAVQLLSGKRLAYSLCRPPGHHAETSRCGGYCYFNNASIAAHYLSKQCKVSLLDVDYHHGNGSQEIFYSRNDVQYVSLHANPEYDYPYFAGFSDETGSGKGRGFNINIPLKKKTSQKEYMSALCYALDKIKKFNPGFLVLSLGVDTYEIDPVGGFNLDKLFFIELGKTISELNLPVLIIQEGGYNIADVGILVKNVLTGFGIN